MKVLTSAEVRQMFLDFFKEKGHAIEPSAPLVPQDDASLLWINSGVATLKKYFDGRVIPANPRIVNAQKSIRTNDIENVGKTARHHTFFEMLGNFSIGDYFKEEAIIWAWEFLTSEKWIGFEAEKLSVTIHPEDNEAFEIWTKTVGVLEENVIRLEGNFWDIGEGPSGPNTEIFYDRGVEYGNDPADPELYPGGENERYLEVWNLVFSEFNHNPDGSYTPLPKKNIDTGMGLERMCSVIQSVPTNFDTDLFMPIIEATESISGESYRTDKEDTAFKVVADHIRTVTFAIGDGALPSNEGRGYVLRRLLRRAVRYAKKLNINRPFMYELVPVVGEIMVDFYPEVQAKSAFIQKVIKNEEERFHETLNDGLAILSEVVKKQKAAGSSVIPGEDVFRLYDTYGFPVELTEEYAEDEEMKLDHSGFEEEMKKQRERARAARQEVGSMQVQGGVLGDLTVESSFIGYDTLTVHSSSILALVQEGQLVDEVHEGQEVQVIMDKTPFYAESGGQIADEGYLVNEGVTAKVKDVKKAPNGQNLHSVIVESGILKTNDLVEATVNKKSRTGVIKNHTATHLLHQALKDTLGTHVNQAGSLVTENRLRFDFSHFGQVTEDELTQIEIIVNEKIWESINVRIEHKPIAEAKAMGAMALFGEKYGDIVRVVQVGDYSLELCGGCHVENTASIGIFKIVSESGIGAGTRRIEAVTGKGAYELMNGQLAILSDTAAKLKTSPKEVSQRVDSLLLEMKSLQRENESLTAKLGNAEVTGLVDKAVKINGVTLLASKVNAKDMNSLRTMMDELKNTLGSAIVVLGAASDGKVNLAAGVTKDLTEKGYHAGKLIKEVATRCGGSGGGRPDMAQAGGKDPEKLDAALNYAEEWVKSVL
ncbi:alanine--tRNA ligase [Metabacillus sp. RGM 3146]|uniref:alanine--tRNA ligase n=1 Tax=Metabacillus sp. RGM 3146 TaxID=3401092 RepID=UPI003B9C8E73